MSDSQPAQAPGAQGQGRGGRRRGRGGGFGAARQPGQTDGHHHHSHDGAGRGARSRGQGPRRGGGSGGRDKQGRSGNKPEASAAGGQGDTNAQTASEGKGKQPVTTEESDDADDGEVCFICASKVDHTSVSPCNHRTCHICALRLRALYKNKACAHCRVCVLSDRLLWSSLWLCADIRFWIRRNPTMLSSRMTMPSATRISRTPIFRRWTKI